MVLLSALGTDACTAEGKGGELGPALVIISEYCTAAAVPDVWFKAIEQRDDLQLAINSQFLDIQTQASAIPKKVEQGKNVQLTMSLGPKSSNPDVLAVIFDSTVITDATTPTTKSVEITDSPGKNPTYYQVAIIPYDGNDLDFSYGWVILYGMAMADQSTFTFSPTTQRNTAFSFMGEKHPTLGSRAVYYQSDDGSDVTQLVDIAAEYTAAQAA